MNQAPCANGPEKRSRERRHFDRLAQERGKLWWGNDTRAGRLRMDRRALAVRQMLKDCSDPVVLEIGAGAGAFSRDLRRICPSVQFLGCDLSEAALRVAQVEIPGFPCLVGDATELPVLDGCLDAVIGNSILHHVPLSAALRACHRALKPKGCLWFSEPNMLNPQIAAEKNVKWLGRLLHNSPDETAFFRWRLSRVLSEAGFEAISVEPFDFLHPLVPDAWASTIDRAGRWLERIPLLREISGSLLIQARKP